MLHQALYKRAPRQSQPPRPPSWIVQQEYEWKVIQRSNLSLYSKVQQEANQGEHSSWSSPDTAPSSQPWLVSTRVRQYCEMDLNTENQYLMKYNSVTVHGSVCVMDCQWGDSVPELYAQRWPSAMKKLGICELLSSPLSIAIFWSLRNCLIVPWHADIPLGCVISSQDLWVLFQVFSYGSLFLAEAALLICIYKGSAVWK